MVRDRAFVHLAAGLTSNTGLYLPLFGACLWMTLYVQLLSPPSPVSELPDDDSQRPLHTRASRFLLVAVLLLFAATTAQFVIDTTLILNQLQYYLTRTDIPLSERRTSYTEALDAVRIAAAWPIVVNVRGFLFLVRSSR